MQYNDTTGTLNITDPVNIAGSVNVAGATMAIAGSVSVAGATMSIAGNAYLASGTALSKRVAAISVHRDRRDLLPTETMVLTVAANEAPNFINVQASCRMQSRTAGEGPPVPYGSTSRSLVASHSGGSSTTLGSLAAMIFIWITDGDNRESASGCTPAVVSTLIAGVDYNPNLPVNITIGPRVTTYITDIDDSHNLTVICG